MNKILYIILIAVTLTGCFVDSDQMNEQTGNYVKLYTKKLYEHPYVSCLNATSNVLYSRYDRDMGYLGVMTIRWTNKDGELVDITHSKHNLSLQSLDNDQVLMLFLPKKDHCSKG